MLTGDHSHLTCIIATKFANEVIATATGLELEHSVSLAHEPEHSLDMFRRSLSVSLSPNRVIPFQ